MIFVLSQAWDEANILSPREEWNFRPLDSVLQCSTKELQCSEPQRLHGEQDPLPSSISTTYTTEPRPNTCFNLCQAFNKGLLKSLMHVQPDVHGKLRMREMNLPRLQTTDGINFCNIHYSTKTFESWAATLTNLVKQKDLSVTITMYHF